MAKQNNILQKVIQVFAIFFLCHVSTHLVFAASDAGTASLTIQSNTSKIGVNSASSIDIVPSISTTPEDKGISGFTVVVNLDVGEGKTLQISEDDITLNLSSPWTTVMKEVKTNESKTTISASLLYFAPGDAPAASIPAGTSILSVKFTPQSLGLIKASIDSTASSIIAAADNSDILNNQPSSISVSVVDKIDKKEITEKNTKIPTQSKTVSTKRSYEYSSDDISLDQQAGNKPVLVNNMFAIIIAIVLISCIGGGVYMYFVAQKTKVINIEADSTPIVLKKELPSIEEPKL